MKFYIIEYSANSTIDIKTIHDYIANENNEPENAQIVVESIHESIKGLNIFPSRFHIIDEKDQLRSFPINGYVVIYRVLEGTCKVVILRILGARQDIQSKLCKNL